MKLDDLFGMVIDKPDADISKKIKAVWDNKSKPIDSLGLFEELICQLGAIQGKLIPQVDNRAVIVMCADNGIVARNISQSGQDITLAVARALGKGTSSVCNLASFAKSMVIPVDIGINSDEKIDGVIDAKVAKGTRDFLTEPAMTAEETLLAIEMGIKLVQSCKEDGIDLIATGEMGIGNTTTSTALLCSITGEEPIKITGRGSGLDDEGLSRKVNLITEGIRKYSFEGINDKKVAFEKLRTFGGLDLAGLVGIYIGGAVYKLPVIIDGLISAVAALCASIICPGAVSYMIASHVGKEGGTAVALEALGLQYFINANMALGEGTGAVMMFPIIDMIMNFYTNGSTFADYEIDNYKRFN